MRENIKTTAAQAAEGEIWKPIDGFQYYEASSLGRMRSLDRLETRCNGVQVRRAGKVIEYQRNRKVRLTRNGRPERLSLAELICRAFHGAPRDSAAFHINGNHKDMRASNLEWVPRDQEAQRHVEFLMLHYPSEEWRPVYGHEGQYLISDAGNIWSIRRYRMLRPVADAEGYRLITIKDKLKKMHRLVAFSFFGPPSDPDLTDVNHLNGIKDDNRLCNLEWSTQEDNNRHSREVLGNHHGAKAGDGHHSIKIKDGDVPTIYQLFRDGVHAADIAARFGVHQRAINDIAAGRRRPHLHKLHGGPTPEECKRGSKIDRRRAIQILAIKAYVPDEPLAKIAKLYGVTASTISAILTGKRWPHIYREFHGEA